MREFWVGAYAAQHEPGLQRLRWDPADRTLVSVAAADALVNPTFLVARPDRAFLYAVSEIENGEGAVACFAVGADGALRLVNQTPSGGAVPCHLALSPEGGALVVAHYLSGSVAVFPLDPAGPVRPLSSLVQLQGSGPVVSRQQGPRAHQVVFDGPERVLVCDLGADRIHPFRWDSAHRSLTPDASLALISLPGSGPRHLCVHPTLGLLFVANELSSTLSVFDRDGRMLQTLATTRGNGEGVNYPSHIALTPDARFVLVANRGDDTLAVFAVNATTGALKHVGYAPAGGAWPRHFAILDADGRGGLPWHVVVACQHSGSVAVLPLDPVTGMPGPAVAQLAAVSPACILPV